MPGPNEYVAEGYNVAYVQFYNTEKSVIYELGRTPDKRHAGKHLDFADAVMKEATVPAYYDDLSERFQAAGASLIYECHARLELRVPIGAAEWSWFHYDVPRMESLFCSFPNGIWW